MATLVRSASAGIRGRSLGSRILGALALRRSRAKLGGLPDHLLDDMGISREEALREASRRVWDVPTWWRG